MSAEFAKNQAAPARSPPHMAASDFGPDDNAASKTAAYIPGKKNYEADGKTDASKTDAGKTDAPKTPNTSNTTTNEQQPQADGVTNATTKDQRPSLNGHQTTNGQSDVNGVGNGVKHRRTTDLKDKFAAEKDKLTEKKERIRDKTKPPGGYDTTPAPQCEPGFTLKFTFHRAFNLPAADISSTSADPFIKATLTTDLPTRHREDPVMVHRTRTIHRSTAPVWDEDWIVANVPASGFRLKCRLYDEDSNDHDDRLGNVTYETTNVNEKWTGLDHAQFDVKKRMGSKRAYFFKIANSLIHGGTSITPILELSIQVLGRSDSPGGRLYTLGPTLWVRHFSPMIGRITGTRVNKDEREDENSLDNAEHPSIDKKHDKRMKKYDFQANEIQLQGPIPEKLYHRYVEFRPIIGRMFSDNGLRGRILNKALHKQHNRVYNFSTTTEYGSFEPCSEQASLQFLKLAHFDEGGRIFTYVLSLDGILRFTETGKEFGIDLLSKHTMHSDVETYIAFSGEFFIRRLSKPTNHASEPDPPVPTHPEEHVPGGPPSETPPHQPGYYQLVIDNDSGTYRPDKSLLPLLKEFLERNFPGLGVVAMHWEDETLQEMKKAQLKIKKKEGPAMHMVLHPQTSHSSLSSSDESRINAMEEDDEQNGPQGEHRHRKTKKELAWDLLEDPTRIKDLHLALGRNHPQAESSSQAK